MSRLLHSNGSMTTTFNNKVIDENSYKFNYDGNVGKGIVKSNKDYYYIELDNNDLDKIFKKPHDNSDNIENKLNSLLNKPTRKPSKKTLKQSKKTHKQSKKTSKTSSKTRKTSNKTKSRKTKSRKTKSRKTKKSKRKKKSIKKTNMMPLETKFLKTLI